MKYPIIVDSNFKNKAILEKAYEIILADEMITSSTGYETLSFKMLMADKKRALLSNEEIIDIDGRYYIVRVVNDVKSSSSVCTISCDALWYDLSDGELKTHISDVAVSAESAITEQLVDTGWQVGTIDDLGTHRFTLSEEKTSLYNIRQIASTFEGEIEFDSKERKINLKTAIGSHHQKIFCYEKNTPQIQRTVDTRDLFTRFTLIGKDADGNPVTISDINNGLSYVENYAWYDRMGLTRKVKILKKSDDRFSNKQNMKTYMENQLASMSMPSVSYQLSVALFDTFPQLGDYIYVKDAGLGIAQWLRVFSRKIDILQPYKSTVTLEQPSKTITSANISNQTATSDAIAQVVRDTSELLPVGAENYVMQYIAGRWQATNAVNLLKQSDVNFAAKFLVDEALLSSNSTKISDNELAISANTSLISNINSKIEADELILSQHTTNLASNLVVLNSHTSKLAANDLSIADLISRIAALELKVNGGT